LADRGGEPSAITPAVPRRRPIERAQNRAALVSGHVGPLGPGGPIVGPHLLPVRFCSRPQPDLAAVRHDGREGDVVAWDSPAKIDFVTSVPDHVILLSARRRRLKMRRAYSNVAAVRSSGARPWLHSSHTAPRISRGG